MTELDLQQYKYRRNFPYNNTIKEESDEHLSENRSTKTFNSIHPKNLLNQVLMRQVNQIKSLKSNNKKFVYNKNFIKSNDNFEEADKFFNMKSEHLIRNFNNSNENEEIIVVEDYGNEFTKQTSERCIKTSKKDIRDFYEVISIF
jgi:antitoxin component of MazEF toxin-antitoxin module